MRERLGETSPEVSLLILQLEKRDLGQERGPGEKKVEVDLETAWGLPYSVTRRYKPLGHAGYGAYGTIRTIVAQDLNTGQPVAVKQIPDVLRSDNFAKCILREIKLLRHLKGHENLLYLLGMEIVPMGNGRYDVSLVSGLMESDLAKVIRTGQFLSLHHCEFFLYQILRGLKCLHTANIVHRDVTPANCLVNADCDLRICDFGLSRVVPNQHSGRRAGGDGNAGEDVTPLTGYSAPELICGQEDYETAVDIWSVGCIALEILIGQPLFRGRDAKDQLTQIVRFLGKPTASDMVTFRHPLVARFLDRVKYNTPKMTPERLMSLLPKEASRDPAFADLVCRMLSWNPAHRPTAAEALSHELFAELHREEDEPEAPELNEDVAEMLERLAGSPEGGSRKDQKGDSLRGDVTSMLERLTLCSAEESSRGDKEGEETAGTGKGREKRSASSTDGGRKKMFLDEFFKEASLVSELNKTPSYCHPESTAAQSCKGGEGQELGASCSRDESTSGATSREEPSVTK
uniref:Protein kinase domain-containing protein n=1 Tax=Chromera velia CCMP2878 TaxID=1169474 RepID=A0A0G4HKM3_9ALVE|eukprot:Cvel_28489.t1-p1 / transcript=Cvel_28489.t1 / gene=Cvel_28489 / organism=Chromera_velia_CCMP2878 / gene_product=Mitogen-activated protein kinase 5, putative / transcript_product=Mitogen-activated protein kinase 5, putative / location=Cvel_scaffold3739:9395-13779(+) / protein_length=516 / sequence_SO=supercontig / SO=protein_coding / is_pseudo=false